MEKNTNKKMCLKCNKENVEDANFCEYCGTKLSERCSSCWKKEGQPHSCPDNKCERN